MAHSPDEIVEAIESDTIALMKVEPSDGVQLDGDSIGLRGGDPFDLPPVNFVDLHDVSAELRQADDNVW